MTTDFPIPGPGEITAAMETADDPCIVVEDTLPAFVLDEVHPTDRAHLDAHFAACGSCRRQRDGMEGALSDTAAPNEAPEPAAAIGLRRGNYGLMESPVGDLLMVVTDSGLCDVSYLENHTRDACFERLEDRGILATERSAPVAPVREQLAAYFAGQRSGFDLPVDLHGVTPFTQQVLVATLGVPFGAVDTYQGIAAAIGRPSASRAVGNALGRNPVPVVVPCHRVIRSDGSMGWYTGGAHIKQKLLGIEGASVATQGRLGLS